MSEKKWFEVNLEVRGYVSRTIEAENEEQAFDIVQQNFDHEFWVVDATVEEIED